MPPLSNMRILSLVFIAALILAPAACSRDKKQTAKAKPPVPVTVAKALAKDMPLELSAIGQVEPLATVSVTARVSGQLIKVHFNEGDLVEKGQLLFSIDPRPFQAALDQAQADLVRDQAKYKQAAQELVRYSKMVKKKFVSREDYDQKVADAASQKAVLAADRAAIETAKLNLSYCSIHSPLTGRTGELLVNAGNQVEAGGGPALVVINQVQPIYVGFSLPERQLPLVSKYRAQQELKVRAVLPGADQAPLWGQLSFVDNKVSAQTGTVRLRATLANPDERLWPGLFVNAYLRLTVQKGAVVVPGQAVQRGPKGTVVFVVGADNKVQMHPVTVSRAVGNLAIIAKGVKAGDTVVTGGQLLLYPGAKVKIKKMPTTAQSLKVQSEQAAQRAEASPGGKQ